MPKHIALICNTMFYIHNFRRGIIRRLQAQGHTVIAIAPFDSYEAKLRKAGVRCLDLPFRSNTTNPLHDLWLFFRYVRLFRRKRPDCVLSFTIKPNIYGSLAARLCRIPTINTITGLGSSFIRVNLLTKFVGVLYRLALYRSRRVFFQNDADLELFLEKGFVRRGQCGRLPGSGVNLDHYAPRPPVHNARFTFLFIGRLLRDKGVFEFVAAAETLRDSRAPIACELLGEIDVDNPTTVTRAQMSAWEDRGVIRYLGTAADVRPEIARADCIVLPSYREGLSRTLLEASAMSKPIIAADVPGCREVVDDGVTGLLCRVRDASALTAAMRRLAALSPAAREEMGKRGRQKVEREFDERLVIQAYSRVLDEIFPPQEVLP